MPASRPCKEGTGKMRTHLVIAGLLAVGAMGSLLADAAVGHTLGKDPHQAMDPSGLGIAATVEQGCLGEPGSWLPGTLQIESPAAAAGTSPQASASSDEASVYDCSLV